VELAGPDFGEDTNPVKARVTQRGRGVERRRNELHGGVTAGEQGHRMEQ
jgi:hypothetical protein